DREAVRGGVFLEELQLRRDREAFFSFLFGGAGGKITPCLSAESAAAGFPSFFHIVFGNLKRLARQAPRWAEPCAARPRGSRPARSISTPLLGPRPARPGGGQASERPRVCRRGRPARARRRCRTRRVGRACALRARRPRRHSDG